MNHIWYSMLMKLSLYGSSIIVFRVELTTTIDNHTSCHIGQTQLTDH